MSAPATTPDDATLIAWIDALFDFTCTRRASDFIDVEQLLAAVDVAAEAPRLSRLVARFSGPARTRVLARLKVSAVLLGAWLPEPVRDALALLMAQPVVIPRPLIDQVIADEHVRETTRTIMHETLSSFINKAFAVAPGGRGLRGVIGLGARAAGGLLGGLGDELKRQLEERTGDFVDAGMHLIQQRVAHKLASEETARLLGQRRRAAFLELLKKPESEVAKLAERVPWAALEAMLPAIVTHNLARAEVRTALVDEVKAVVAELSALTVGEWLDELGVRELTRAFVQAHALPLAHAFVAAGPFATLPPLK
jgi:hypothetical protein